MRLLEATPGTDAPTWMRSLLPLLLLLLCLGVSGTQTIDAQQATVTRSLADYQTQLLRWQATLAQPDGAANLEAVQQAIAAIQQIELPNGTVLNLQPLLGNPAAETLDLATAQRRLATLIDELNATANDDTDARLALLTTIFQRTEFVSRDSLWDRFWRWLRTWLPDRRTGASNAGSLAPLFQGLGWALVGVGVVLLIWLLSYWLQNLLGSFMGGVERRPPDIAGEIPQTAVAARSSAHQLAGAGSYREAVRYLYLSALLTLYERDLITYQPSDTNREVLTALRDQPHLYQQLQPVVKTFDDVWYGVHEPDRASFDTYVAAVEKLEEAQ